MVRLTIEEVIAHCERKIEVQEQIMQKEMLETLPLENSWIKEYWEHRQVREWLLELQKIRKQSPIGTDHVKHGNWGKPFNWGGLNNFRCSHCDKTVVFDKFTTQCHYDYCPHCGARMDGE